MYCRLQNICINSRTVFIYSGIVNHCIMMSVEEFTGKMRQLIDMERHAEIEETRCVLCNLQ